MTLSWYTENSDAKNLGEIAMKGRCWMSGSTKRQRTGQAKKKKKTRSKLEGGVTSRSTHKIQDRVGGMKHIRLDNKNDRRPSRNGLDNLECCSGPPVFSSPGGRNNSPAMISDYYVCLYSVSFVELRTRISPPTFSHSFSGHAGRHSRNNPTLPACLSSMRH